MQNEQASEHDQKQDQVGNYCRDKTEYAGLGLDRVTGILCRDPNSMKLRMRWAKWVQIIKISHLPGRHLYTKLKLNKIPGIYQKEQGKWAYFWYGTQRWSPNTVIDRVTTTLFIRKKVIC